MTTGLSAGATRRSIALMIETVGLGGAEAVVLQLAQELRDRGHDVHPIVPAGREGWLVDGFRNLGLAWQTYDLRGPIDPTLPGRMAEMLGRPRVDVVHSHEFVMAVYGAAAARRLKRPHVITMHGNQEMTRRLRRRIALRWAFRHSTATVAVSNHTREHLESSLGLPASLVQVIHNGIPIRPGERDGTRRRLGVAPEDLLLVAVGNLHPRKGHAVLLQALIALTRDGPAPIVAPGHCGGVGPRAGLSGAHTIQEAGFSDRARLLGPRDDVPDLLAAADIFVMPSLWEGLPLAILEAMFAGKAIVASGISGIPEAIDHGQHGLLIPAGEAVALRDALRSVMDDDALRARLGAQAPKRAYECFTIATLTDSYERLYADPVRE